MSENKKVIIYTDGACSGNPGPGGWAAILCWNGREKTVSGGEPHTTNNRMELIAAIEALKTLKRPVDVELFSDSSYVVKGITEWVFSWIRRGWKRKGGEVENVDLWKELYDLSRRYRITWRWVRGHAGNPMNEKVDRLAREEVEKISR